MLKTLHDNLKSKQASGRKNEAPVGRSVCAPWYLGSSLVTAERGLSVQGGGKGKKIQVKELLTLEVWRGKNRVGLGTCRPYRAERAGGPF